MGEEEDNFMKTSRMIRVKAKNQTPSEVSEAK